MLHWCGLAEGLLALRFWFVGHLLGFGFSFAFGFTGWGCCRGTCFFVLRVDCGGNLVVKLGFRIGWLVLRLSLFRFDFLILEYLVLVF